MIKRILSMLLITTLMLTMVQIPSIAVTPYTATATDYTVWYKETNAPHNVSLQFFLPYTTKNVQSISPSVPSGSTSVITSVSAGSPSTSYINIVFADVSATAFAGYTTETIKVDIVYTDTTTDSKNLTVTVRELLYHDVSFVDNLSGAKVTDVTMEMIPGTTKEQMVKEDTFNADLTDYTVTSGIESVAKVGKNAANNAVVLSPVGIGTSWIMARKPASTDGKYSASGASLLLAVNGSATSPADGTANVDITYDGLFDSFDQLHVNGNIILPQNSPTGGVLTNYPGYTGNIGEYRTATLSGATTDNATVVTLYADFIKFLQQNNVANIPVVYEDRTDTVSAPTNHSVQFFIRSLDSHTVSFNANGGTGTMADVVLTEAPGTIGVNYTLPSSTFTAPTGQQFVRWGIEDPDAPGTFKTYHDVGATYMVIGNVTFHAIWENVPTPTPTPEPTPVPTPEPTPEPVQTYTPPHISPVTGVYK